jgi:ribose transport system permease protein
VRAGLEVEAIAAVVIGGGSLTGGEGSIGGTLAGALLLAVLYNGCSKLQLPNESRYILIGTILVAVAALNQWRQGRAR